MRFLMMFVTAFMLALPAGATEMGDDGLHKTPWMRETFKDMAEDMAEANAEGRKLLVIWEQRGCIYCSKMHEDVLPRPEIDAMLSDEYFVVQLNLFGDVEVTDFDGEVLSERDMAMKWGIIFTPTFMFFGNDAEPGLSAKDAAIATMPGAFGFHTTKNLLRWILDGGYLGDENFQKYHARVFAAEQNGG